MKAKLIRDDIEASETAAKDAKGIEVREVRRNGETVPVRFWTKGATIEHPDAYRLVQMGIAEPADDECKEKANRTEEQLKAARYAYERQVRGIAPDDFDRYDRGEISRMLPDGTYEPGPNAVEEDDDDEEDDDEPAPKPKTRKKT